MLGTSKVNRLLILGNGFDVDLGMKSRYSDFAKSTVWNEKIENNAEAMARNGLLKVLVDAKRHDNWFDIEQTMMDYVRRQQALAERTNYDYESCDDDVNEYHLICNSLRTYLQEESESFTPNNSSVAEDAIKDLLQKGLFNKVYTFNYTDLKTILAKKLCMEVNIEVVHLHGSLRPPDDIILGIEGGDIIPEEYKFMYKTSSRYYRSNNLYTDLQNANEVVFFGHSINGMDFDYFKDFFNVQSSDSIEGYRRKWIRIFTYDEPSMQSIMYSLRGNRIDPKDLYRLNNFAVIQTKDLEIGDPWEKKKYAQFTADIARLRSIVPGKPVNI